MLGVRPSKLTSEDLEAVGIIVDQKSAAFTAVYERIRTADWYVLLARKADTLLRKLLFERVYARKVRGFAQQFRGAETRQAIFTQERSRYLKKLPVYPKGRGPNKNGIAAGAGDILGERPAPCS